MSKNAEAKAPSEKNYATLIRPMITEKATQVSAHNQVVFEVQLKANKADIRDAVQNLFKVKVTGVNTTIRKGKTKAFRGRFGEQSDVKKAIVTLEEGHRIDVTTGL